jgi:hypothetical protein
MALLARLDAVAMGRSEIVDRSEVARIVVVPGLDMVHPIRSASAADVADSTVSGEHLFAE